MFHIIDLTQNNKYIQYQIETLLKDKAKNIPAVIEATTLPERDVPEYVEVDHSKFSGSLLRIPMPDDVPYPVQMETNLVIEFYSR